MMREDMCDFVSYQLFPVVLNMSLTASVVIVFVLLARLLLKKAPKVYSYALWAVVLFRLLCPVSITSRFSLLALTDPPVLKTTTQTNYVAYIPPDIVHTEFPQVQLPVPGMSDTINKTLPQGREQLAADPLEFPVTLATMIWLLGILILLIYNVVSLILLRRRLLGAIPLGGNLYLAGHIDTPFVMGILRPRIYLPSVLSDREQEYIVLHERHHIRRSDHIIKMLIFVALCIHWFNPLVWLAFVLSGKDMEMSCDEAVLKQMGEGIRADYSASLVCLATGRHIIAGMPLAFGEGDTGDRIRNLLTWKQPKVWFTLAATVLCMVVIAGCGVNPKERNDSSESGIELVTVVTPEDPNAVYGVVECGSLSNGIEYWIVNPTPTERVRMDLLGDSKTFKVRVPIVNEIGDDGADVGGAIGVDQGEFISVRVGGLPSTMPTVNVGCHYVDGDHADWYPSVGADALVVFKIGAPSSNVQITTSTCESASVTTSFTISTSVDSPVEPTQRFASMEDYAAYVMGLETEIDYYTDSEEMKTAKITGRKLDLLNKSGELEDLAPDGVLEVWEFHHSVQIDADPEEIAFLGGQGETAEGWYDFEGQGGHILVALRCEDSSYNILSDQFVNDNMDFYGYHNSWEDALYDWYVREYGLEHPAEVIDLLPTLKDAGNHPAYRS